MNAFFGILNPVLLFVMFLVGIHMVYVTAFKKPSRYDPPADKPYDGFAMIKRHLGTEGLRLYVYFLGGSFILLGGLGCLIKIFDSIYKK